MPPRQHANLSVTIVYLQIHAPLTLPVAQTIDHGTILPHSYRTRLNPQHRLMDVR